MSDIVAIIVSFRTPEDVLDCLASIAKQTHPVDRVVICENGGTEHTEQLRANIGALGDFSAKITIIDAPDNPGYGGGINRAIAMAPDGAFVWIVNPDTVARPECLAHMLRCAKDGPYDIVGGVTISQDGIIKDCGGTWSPVTGYAQTLFYDRPLADKPVADDVMERLSFISGANMLVSRRVLEIAGPIREDYFLYAEEVEWCVRASANGLRLGYCPEAIIMHKHGTSTGSATAHASRPRLPIYCDTRNRILTVRDTSPRHLPLAVCGVLLQTTLRYLPRRAWRQWLYAMEGWLAGIRNERGKPGWAR